MRTNLNSCFLLHRRPYLEGSLLLEIFSRHHGRRSLVARGARRGNKKKPALQPFQRLLLSWGGRGELNTLYRWEVVDPSFKLDNNASLAALYMNELLLCLLHRYEAHMDLFDAYEHGLAALAADDLSHDVILRRFEASLLCTLGYGPAWDRDARTGEEIQPDHLYYYEWGQGPCRQPLTETAQPISGRALLWLAGRTDIYDTENTGQTKALMRGLIDKQLAGRRLASRELYSDFLRLGRSSSKETPART